MNHLGSTAHFSTFAVPLLQVAGQDVEGSLLPASPSVKIKCLSIAFWSCLMWDHNTLQHGEITLPAYRHSAFLKLMRWILLAASGVYKYAVGILAKRNRYILIHAECTFQTYLTKSCFSSDLSDSLL